MRSVFVATIGTTLLAAACNTAEVPSEPLSSNTTESAATSAPVSLSEPVAAQTLSEPVRTAPAPVQTRTAQRQPASVPAPTREVVTREAAAPRSTPAVKVPEYREIDVPAGTPLALSLATPVASDRSQVEEPVRATLREAVLVNGETVLPAGTEVMGRITDVERSGRVKGRARLAMRFNLVRYEGDEYDVRSEAIERLAAATKSEDATKIGIGAGAGAAIGAILGGGSGAAKGAAIGAAAGTGTVLATRGEEVRLEAGESLDTRLTSTLPVRVRVP